MTEKKKKIAIIAVIAAAAAALAATLIPLTIHNSKQSKYNEGVTMLEKGNLDQALKIFDELGDFDDAYEMREFTQAEIDYRSLDSFVLDGEYKMAADILRTRSGYYKNTEEGELAASLAEEYDIVDEAYNDLAIGYYTEALEKFDGLDLLKEDFGIDRCLCRAYVAEESHDWLDILANLYAVQNEDFDLAFLNEQNSESEKKAFKAYSSADGNALAQLIELEDEEIDRLIETALNGFIYDEASKQLSSKNYSKAMELFEGLEDFLDSEDLYAEAKTGYEQTESIYNEAEQYFNNQEFYKAKKRYEKIKDYKDAAQKASACVQPLPENGAFTSGNGSQTSITIIAPAGEESVYLKAYDSSGAEAGKVFIRPGASSPLSLASGTYTMKVGYGTEWYGEKDIFGEKGDYVQLLNGSETSFYLEPGGYTLELLAGSDGNVGSRSIDGAQGM